MPSTHGFTLYPNPKGPPSSLCLGIGEKKVNAIYYDQTN